MNASSADNTRRESVERQLEEDAWQDRRERFAEYQTNPPVTTPTPLVLDSQHLQHLIMQPLVQHTGQSYDAQSVAVCHVIWSGIARLDRRRNEIVDEMAKTNLRLIADCEKAERELAKARADSERLDWLEHEGRLAKFSDGWIAWTSGDEGSVSKSARQAIDAARNAKNKEESK